MEWTNFDIFSVDCYYSSHSVIKSNRKNFILAQFYLLFRHAKHVDSVEYMNATKSSYNKLKFNDLYKQKQKKEIKFKLI